MTTISFVIEILRLINLSPFQTCVVLECFNYFATDSFDFIAIWFITAYSELRKVLFLALFVTFLFVYEISPEPLNGFAPNSQARRVWFLVRTSLNVKVKGQGHRDKNGIFGPFRGLRAVYVW